MVLETHRSQQDNFNNHKLHGSALDRARDDLRRSPGRVTIGATQQQSQGSILMNDDLGKALEQSSVVTVDGKASKHDAVTELITNNEHNPSAFGP